MVSLSWGYTGSLNLIQELTFIIKQDIANINKQLASLQAHVKSQQAGKGSGSKQVEEHNANVVTLLQSKLMSTSMTFKDVLEIRTQVRYALTRGSLLNRLRRI